MNLSLMNNSRSRILAWILLIVGAIFIVRLFYLQVIQYGYYNGLASAEHTTKFTIQPKRGEIYARDSDGNPVPLVLNQPAYTVYADPRYVTNANKAADQLRQIAGGNTVDDFDSLLRDKSKQYVVLAKQVNQSQADLIKKASLDGVGLQEKDQRFYPEGTLASQLLGFVDNDGNGQYGIEGALNTLLTGKTGELKAVTDVHGIPLSIGNDNVDIPAQNGQNVELTIDRNIQSYAEQALKKGLDAAHATKGSVVVMNPQTGQIMAMANMPTYDPSQYTKVSDYSVFQDQAATDPYEAGSVVKTFTMAAGLDKGVIQPNTTYINTGSTQVEDVTINNALKTESLGPTTMVDVLNYSLNTGVVFVLRQLSGGNGQDITKQGRDILYDYFVNHFNLGKKTGIEQAGEAAGDIISPEQPDGNDVRYSNMSFGQGMDVTMVQVAAAFSAGINGGSYYKPELVAGSLDGTQKLTPKAPTLEKTGVIAPTSSQKLQQMLVDARKGSVTSAADPKGYRIGGKTGTSQVIDPKTGKYSDSLTTGSYLGFGGSDSTPRYVIMVRVLDPHIGGYAGTTAAAPIFNDISNWLLGYLKIQPTQ